MKKEETFVLHYKDGTKECYWCKKQDLEKWITIDMYRRLDYITILNRESDKTNHRPFRISL